MRQKVIDYIFLIAKDLDGFEKLEKFVNKLNPEELIDNILDCGVLPEVFSHDSSEEKMWAKYSDIMLSRSLVLLGLEAEVLGSRGNSADVLAKTEKYSIVADAKAFRLSRTAKNQKDFKVQALDNWRQNHHYSLLVSPLYQYPSRDSQIYRQAINHNVSLFSYTHILFLLEQKQKFDLEPIWNIGNTLKKISGEKSFSDSAIYWAKLDEIVCKITKKELVDLVKYKKFTIERTKALGNEGIIYWESKIKEYNNLPKAKAISMLIKAHKIDQKIRQIRKAIDIRDLNSL